VGLANCRAKRRSWTVPHDALVRNDGNMTLMLQKDKKGRYRLWLGKSDEKLDVPLALPHQCLILTIFKPPGWFAFFRLC